MFYVLNSTALALELKTSLFQKHFGYRGLTLKYEYSTFCWYLYLTPCVLETAVKPPLYYF